MMKERATCKKAMIDLMSSGGWWTLWDLGEQMWAKFGVAASDTSISARMRELAHEKRKRENGRGFEYRLTELNPSGLS